ncbi:hypothetical protein HJC23_011865 [Cyclotella cryptica]|uniref:LAGLIDADG homing endonuclease n=1 Tax=Cyclotella cryptica TaxID=29204 RepID=A0ABD3QGF0_9STRA
MFSSCKSTSNRPYAGYKVTASAQHQLKVFRDLRYVISYWTPRSLSQLTESESATNIKNINRRSTGDQQEINRRSTGDQQEINRRSTGDQQDINMIGISCGSSHRHT